MTFKFLPMYKMRTEGSIVQFNDDLLIYNEHLESYLNFSIDKPIWFDRDISLISKE